MGLTGGTLSNTNISNYPCGNTPSLPGQEQTIRIAENLVGNTKLALYGDPQVHMALIAQSGPGCNASNCVDAFQLTGSNYNFIPQPGHTYYLVFDTSTSTPGGYSVELICASDTP